VNKIDQSIKDKKKRTLQRKKKHKKKTVNRREKINCRKGKTSREE
jgi:hypothetical protein